MTAPDPVFTDDDVEAAADAYLEESARRYRDGIDPGGDAQMRAALAAVVPLIVARQTSALEAALAEVRDLWETARDDRDDAIRLMSELMLKAPSAGDDKDGFILGYILPTGPLHRIASYLTQHGQSFPQSRSWAEARDEVAALEAEVERLTALLERNGARWCLCSRADRMNDRARRECPIHGVPLRRRLGEAEARLAAVAVVLDDYSDDPSTNLAAAVCGRIRAALADPAVECICDGGAYEAKQQPFLAHAKCPIHGKYRNDPAVEVAAEQGEKS